MCGLEWRAQPLKPKCSTCATSEGWECLLVSCVKQHVNVPACRRSGPGRFPGFVATPATSTWLRESMKGGDCESGSSVPMFWTGRTDKRRTWTLHLCKKQVSQGKSTSASGIRPWIACRKLLSKGTNGEPMENNAQTTVALHQLQAE